MSKSRKKYDAAIEDRDRQERIDAFAAAALTGLLTATMDDGPKAVALLAYEYAHAMEDRRAKRQRIDNGQETP